MTSDFSQYLTFWSVRTGNFFPTRGLKFPQATFNGNAAIIKSIIKLGRSGFCEQEAWHVLFTTHWQWYTDLIGTLMLLCFQYKIYFNIFTIALVGPSLYLCALVHVLTRSVVQTVCINKHFSPVTFSSWLQSNWTNQHDVLSSPTQSPSLCLHLSVSFYPLTSHSHRSLSLMKNTCTSHNKIKTPLCLIV